MKHLLTIAAVIVSLVGSAFAGPVSFKKTVMEPRVEYGLGWYGAIQAGVNAYQGLPKWDPSVLNDDPSPSTTPNSDVGGAGGVKLGYVFHTGRIRPALETDLFYNGFGYNYQGRFDDGDLASTVAGSVNSFAYMANLLIRFDLGRFQPYVGGGVGGYWASSNVESVSSVNTFFQLTQNGAPGSLSQDTASWAWQVIGGADYYFTEKVSGFFEYKFLNYENLSLFNTGPQIFGNSALPSAKSNLGQQLFVVGVRMHF